MSLYVSQWNIDGLLYYTIILLSYFEWMHEVCFPDFKGVFRGLLCKKSVKSVGEKWLGWLCRQKSCLISIKYSCHSRNSWYRSNYIHCSVIPEQNLTYFFPLCEGRAFFTSVLKPFIFVYSAGYGPAWNPCLLWTEWGQLKVFLH